MARSYHQGRVLTPGIIKSGHVGPLPIQMRVTQKSKTLKGHPFLFGLRQMVTMRE